ncbi:MAG: hypothetical protein AAGC55_22575, partial [Myxococcota bacterium]
EYEARDGLVLGLAYQQRRLGEVAEMLAADRSGAAVLANPGRWPADEDGDLIRRIDELAAQDDDQALEQSEQLAAELARYRSVAAFDRPRRDHRALELSATTRLSPAIVVRGSYTYARTRGNVIGHVIESDSLSAAGVGGPGSPGPLYSPDRADSAEVTAHADGAGSARQLAAHYTLLDLMTNRDGPLIQDRPHRLAVDGTYAAPLGAAGLARVGLRLRVQSGTAQAVVGGDTRIGAGATALLPRGAVGRTPAEIDLDVRLSWTAALGRHLSLTVFGEAFNLLDRQSAVVRDPHYTRDSVRAISGGEYEDLIWLKREDASGAETELPARRSSEFLAPLVYRAPLSLRLGARLEF